LNETSIETITAATDILTHVVNPTLTYKLSQLQALHESIPDSIEQKNFTNLSDDIETYETLISEISNLTNTSYDQYNRTLTAKNNENLLILVLETKDLDPITVSSLEILKAQSDDLNVQFRDGLTIDELAALEGNYTELSEQAQELLQNEGETPSKKAASMFRGLARRINVGIANFVDTNGLIPRSELSENSLALGAFSLITFLSSASFVILFFVYLFALDNFVVPKTSQIIAVALFSLLVILFLFSGFLFIFLDKTSTDATFTEFLSDFSSKDSAAIVVDLRNTTISDATAMQGCANKFANTLSGQNKTWTIYSLGSSTCTIYEQSGTNSTANIADCETSAADSDSSFIFSYSDIDSLTFSIIYENKAEISADKNYYDSCPLTVMFG
jgi:hypothetical protein